MTTTKVTLTPEELAQMNCDCAEPYNWDDHVDSCFVPVVESIVSGAVEAAKAEAWDEGKASSGCECGHSVFAHPSDDYRQCLVTKRGDCDCTCYKPATNPYRETP